MMSSKNDLVEMVSDMLQHYSPYTVSLALEDGAFLETLPWGDDVTEEERQEWIDDILWDL